MQGADVWIPGYGAPSRARATKRSGPSTTRTMLKLAGTLHRLLYRWSAGRIGGAFRGGPVLLLTTTGRRTGRERTWPLSYVVNGDDLVLAASAGGEARPPAWYLNLLATPRVSIQLGESSRTMVARTVVGSERARLWERFVGRYPVAAWYQRRSGRELPVVVLRPVPSADGQYASTGRRGRGEDGLLTGAEAKEAAA